MRVAMPYVTIFDDVEIKEVRPCLIRTSTAPLLEALAALWDAYDEDTKHKEGEIAVVEVAGWEPVTKAGGKKYFRPRFKILGSAPSPASLTRRPPYFVSTGLRRSERFLRRRASVPLSSRPIRRE